MYYPGYENIFCEVVYLESFSQLVSAAQLFEQRKSISELPRRK
jgi:hypothetical protein